MLTNLELFINYNFWINFSVIRITAFLNSVFYMVKVVNVVSLHYFQIIFGLKNPVIDEIVRPVICRHFAKKQSANHRDIKPWRVHDQTLWFQPRALRVFENVCTCYLYINMLLSKHRYSINVTQSPFLSRDVPFTIQALQKRYKNPCTKCYIVVLYVYTLTNSILPAILIIEIEEVNAPTRNA